MKRAASGIVAMAGAVVIAQALMAGATHAKGRGQGDLITVYVASQGLYYDSFVAAERLPPKGRFQQLDPAGGPHGGPATEFGPGDHDFVGGRWWVDANSDGVMDEDDVYFSCPLLGPGRIDL